MHQKVKIDFLFEFPLQPSTSADQKDVQTGVTGQHIIKFQQRLTKTSSLEFVVREFDMLGHCSELSPKLYPFRDVLAMNNLEYPFL